MQTDFTKIPGEFVHALGAMWASPLRGFWGFGEFYVTDLDFWEKSVILKITRVLPANEQLPVNCEKEVTAIVLGLGGYFFLSLQTLITRLMTLTMRIQNWKSSEYVTISRCPPFCVSEGTKRRFTLRLARGEPPACRLSVAPE